MVYASEKSEENKEIHEFAQKSYWLIKPFDVKYIINIHCLNLLSKPENDRVFRCYRIFHSNRFLLVILVTDRKCNVADNVVLATLSSTVLVNLKQARMSSLISKEHKNKSLRIPFGHQVSGQAIRCMSHSRTTARQISQNTTFVRLHAHEMSHTIKTPAFGLCDKAILKPVCSAVEVVPGVLFFLDKTPNRYRSI